VLLAALAAPALGLLLAWLTKASLALGHLTHQPTDPLLAVPWWPLAFLTVSLASAAALAVAVESTLRARHRLGDVLRA
jgi:putative ABC transport system permease protein